MKETKKTKKEGLQKVTKTNKKEKRYLVDDLAVEHQRAVFLRIEGAEYQYIAKELKYNYTYVRQLFAEGGLCKPAYEELVALITAENRERFEKLQDELTAAAPEAFGHLRRFAKKNWKAAESLLHIAGFTPLQKIKAEVDNGDLDKVSEVIDKLSDYARQTTPPSNEGTT